ncbi:hypothetical protein G6F62_015104 [Rhizopus arrhizus]|nr:hypothetical protein G6F62_015104 [Rhizopus arrhizus]
MTARRRPPRRRTWGGARCRPTWPWAATRSRCVPPSPTVRCSPPPPATACRLPSPDPRQCRSSERNPHGYPFHGRHYAGHPQPPLVHRRDAAAERHREGLGAASVAPGHAFLVLAGTVVAAPHRRP